MAFQRVAVQDRVYLSGILPIKNLSDKLLAEPTPDYTPTPYGAFISDASLRVARWTLAVELRRVLLGLSSEIVQAILVAEQPD